MNLSDLGNQITASSSTERSLFVSFIKNLETSFAIHPLVSKSVLFALIEIRALPFLFSVAELSHFIKHLTESFHTLKCSKS